MRKEGIKKIIITILFIIFIVEPILQFYTGTGTAKARECVVYGQNTQPNYNKKTETIAGYKTMYRYTFKLWGSENNLKIWDSDMSKYRGKTIYFADSHINNGFTATVVYEGKSHLRNKTGCMLPRKRREGVSLSFSATYVSDWTTKNTNDARDVCSQVHVTDGLINTYLKSQKEILNKEVKKIYTIVPKNQSNTNNGSPLSNMGQHLEDAVNEATKKFNDLIEKATNNNNVKPSKTEPAGSPRPNSSTGGSSSGTGTNNQTIIDRTDLSDNARRLYIRNLYKRVLKREPSNDEIESHFKKTSQKEASDIIFSPESNNKNNIKGMTNEQFVEASYNYILGRTSDPSGKASWINYLAKGNSRESLVNQFVASTEFKNKNNKETSTLTFNANTCTAVYENLRNNGNTIIKPTNTTILMYKEDLSKVTSLDLSGKNLTDLNGLKAFMNLSKLSVSNNKLTDLSKVSELTNLEQLVINNNNLKNLNGIDKLTKLYLLNASNNQISDIKGVEKLSKLKTINLNNNKVSDLSALTDISTLKEVYADYNNVKNTSAFKNVDKISLKNNTINLTTTNGEVDLPSILINTKTEGSSLYTSDDFECINCKIENNKIIMSEQKASVAVKSGNAKDSKVILTNQTEILSFNDKVLAEKIKEEFNLTDIKEYNGKYLLFITKDAIMSKKSIDLASRDNKTKITDISGLEKLSQLTSINLRNNNITDFSKLSELEHLESLDVRYNGLTNLQTINKLKQLKQLDASQNNITDITGIENLSELQDLLLSYNKIGNNIGNISNLHNLITVSLIENEITDVSGLANLKAEKVYLDRNGISDISMLKKENIAKISLENNNVVINVSGSESEIPEILKKALEDNGGIENLKCTGCSIKDNKIVFDDGIKSANIQIKSGDLRDTVVTLQNGEALNPPKLDVEYQLSSDKTRMTVTITADKPIQNVLSWDRVSGQNVIRKDYTYNVSNQAISVRDLYGNETLQVIEFSGVKHPKIPDLTVCYSEKMITNKDVTITLKSSENLHVSGNSWTLSNDKKSISRVISKNTNNSYTTADVLTEKMFNSQQQPVHIDVEVANIDKEAPNCEVEYDTTNLTKGAVKVTIWSDEEIEAVNSNIYTKVVKVDENNRKKYGLVLYYTKNEEGEFAVRDLAYNLSLIPVKVDNIDANVAGVYTKVDTVNATNQGVRLKIGADEKISVPEISQSNIIGRLKEIKNLDKEVYLVANTVALDSAYYGYGEPVLNQNVRVANDELSTVGDKEIELSIEEDELGVVLVTDDLNNKDLTLINTSVIDKNQINVIREDVVNSDGSVTVNLQTDKPILVTDALRGWEIGDDLQTLTKTFRENQDFDIELEDFAGNKTLFNVCINNIKCFEYVINYFPIDGTDQVLVVIESERELQEVDGWKLLEDKKHLGKTVGVNDKLTFKIYDLDGFSAEVEVCANEEVEIDNGNGNVDGDGKTEEQKDVMIDNTQSDKQIPQTGQYLILAIISSFVLIVLAGVIIFRHNKKY